MGIKYRSVLFKNGHIGRTFIRPTPESRKLAVAMKFGVLADNVVGKKIVLVDDSIVRGSTIEPVVKLLKEAGAAQVTIIKFINKWFSMKFSHWRTETEISICFFYFII